jgi:hypothetical protein
VAAEVELLLCSVFIDTGMQAHMLTDESHGEACHMKNHIVCSFCVLFATNLTVDILKTAPLPSKFLQGKNRESEIVRFEQAGRQTGIQAGGQIHTGIATDQADTNSVLVEEEARRHRSITKHIEEETKHHRKRKHQLRQTALGHSTSPPRHLPHCQQRDTCHAEPLKR